MKYLLIETRKFDAINLMPGDTLELTWEGEDLNIKMLLEDATKPLSVSEALIIITEDNGIIEGLAIVEGMNEP